MSVQVTPCPPSQSVRGPAVPFSKQPVARSHYRPYSTLNPKQPEAPPQPARGESQRSSVLSKVRRQSHLHRSTSLGDMMGLGALKKKSGEKDASKERITTSSIIRISSVSDLKALSQSAVATSASTKGAVAVSGALTSKDSEPSSSKRANVSVEQDYLSRQSPTTPTSLAPPISRLNKMDAAIVTRSRTPSNPRKRGHPRTDNDVEKTPDPFMDNNHWLCRSRTRVHPYPNEVPYMQSYDPASLEK